MADKRTMHDLNADPDAVQAWHSIAGATHTYTAGWNMPGYLPETDPETFDSLDDAAAYLRETLARWLDDDDAPEDMTAEDIITVDPIAGYADGWLFAADGSAAWHFWANRAD